MEFKECKNMKTTNKTVGKILGGVTSCEYLKTRTFGIKVNNIEFGKCGLCHICKHFEDKCSQ